ncbi:hypothetical protein BV20DRAFT_1031983 [Pilatotrama ljubarskyi]|nr:hypothetical protein BV20DRAFT_1031983 [Pilatotrama ljubarskyi]
MDMPVEGTKLAPKTFRGEAAEVEQFLRRFERLALLHNLTPREKCETIVDYCSRRVRETIQGFAAYRHGNWGELKENVRIFWNADLEDKRFRIKDLQAFAAQSRKQPIQELRDWRRYLRKFIRIAGWLQGQGKLSNHDYAYYMWTGLYVPFRKRLEGRILLEDPNHDMADPFEPEAIRKAAEAILGVNRFDTERLGMDDLYEGDSDDESDEVWEIEEPAKRKKAVRNERARKAYRDDDDSDESDDEEQNAQNGESDFDELIERMKELSVNDPQYGLLYLKAVTIQPMVEDCMPRPQVNQTASDRYADRRMPPPHMSRPDPNRFLSYRQAPPPSAGCFGCGEAGHIMGECPRLQDYVQKGVIMRDHRGRITSKDGMLLRKNLNESWLVPVTAKVRVCKA